MKLYQLAEIMRVGNIKVLECDNPNELPYRRFTIPANSPLKLDYYYADVEYFTVRDSSINVVVKRSKDNG